MRVVYHPLRVVEVVGDGVSVREFSRRLGISTSFAYDLVRKYVREGYLRREDGTIVATEYGKKLLESGSTSVIGIDAASKPFPKVVERNAGIFVSSTVLEVGAGRGRFVRFALKKGVKEYVAVEPHIPYVRTLMEIGDPRLRVVQGLWETVRHLFIGKKFDLLVLWDVLMFMDLTPVHGGTYLSAVLKEVEIFSRMADHILLSFHPVNGIIDKRDFGRIVDKFADNGFEIVDRTYLNYYLRRF